jgi:hypothetical protein
MRKEMLVAAGAGLAIALAIAGGALWINKGSHLELEGSIQKVRVQGLDDAAAIIVDMRVTNPSKVPLVVRDVAMILTDAGGRQLEGQVVAEADVKRFLDYYVALGPKYNDTLKVRERIGAGQSVDRMVAARFEIPDGKVQARKGLRIRVEDVDGAVSEIAEKPAK